MILNSKSLEDNIYYSLNYRLFYFYYFVSFF